MVQQSLKGVIDSAHIALVLIIDRMPVICGHKHVTIQNWGTVLIFLLILTYLT